MSGVAEVNAGELGTGFGEPGAEAIPSSSAVTCPSVTDGKPGTAIAGGNPNAVARGVGAVSSALSASSARMNSANKQRSE